MPVYQKQVVLNAVLVILFVQSRELHMNCEQGFVVTLKVCKPEIVALIANKRSPYEPRNERCMNHTRDYMSYEQEIVV